MSKNKQKKSLQENGIGFAELATKSYAIAVAVLIPLLIHDSYFDILQTKFYVLVGISFIYAVIMSLCIFVGFTEKRLSVKRFLESLTPADYMILLFYFCVLISVIRSPYRKYAFLGESGRYGGVLLMSIYLVIYFGISRYMEDGQLFVICFFVTGLILSGIGLLQYFRIDVFGMKKEIAAKHWGLFTSLLGNINTYTAFMGMSAAAASVCFVRAKKTLPLMFYGLCLFAFDAALVTGNSDNSCLTLGVIFALLPILCWDRRKGIPRYLERVSIFMVTLWFFGRINQSESIQVIGMDSILGKISQWKVFPMLVLAVVIPTIILAVVFRGENGEKTLPGKVIVAWKGLLAAGCLFLLGILWSANSGAPKEGGVWEYLKFQDSWGTNRGMIWRMALTEWKQSELWYQIFGYGPETFGLLVIRDFRDEMTQKTGQIYDAAHNEYLQYLLTYGVMGAFSYLGFLLTVLREMFLGCEDQVAAAAFLAVACYTVQSVINLAQPISGPTFFVLIAVGVWAAHRKHTKE